MIRKSMELKKLDVASIYVLKEAEINYFLSHCNSKHKDTIINDLNKGGKLLQIYHPYFLTSSEVNNPHFLTSCVTELLTHYLPLPFYFCDYWIISNPLIPENPVVYIIIRRIMDISKFSAF